VNESFSSECPPRQEPVAAVEDLDGAHLDAAVAAAEGRAFRISEVMSADFRSRSLMCLVSQVHANGWNKRATDFTFFSPSTDWRDGGPIIAREKIDLMHCEYRGPEAGGKPGEPWNAMMQSLSIVNPDWDSVSGRTPLIAAMRAYVMSKRKTPSNASGL
jgi:hypothetical protein